MKMGRNFVNFDFKMSNVSIESLFWIQIALQWNETYQQLFRKKTWKIIALFVSNSIKFNPIKFYHLFYCFYVRDQDKTEELKQFVALKIMNTFAFNCYVHLEFFENVFTSIWSIDLSINTLQINI